MALRSNEMVNNQIIILIENLILKGGEMEWLLLAIISVVSFCCGWIARSRYRYVDEDYEKKWDHFLAGEVMYRQARNINASLNCGIFQKMIKLYRKMEGGGASLKDMEVDVFLEIVFATKNMSYILGKGGIGNFNRDDYLRMSKEEREEVISRAQSIVSKTQKFIGQGFNVR